DLRVAPHRIEMQLLGVVLQRPLAGRVEAIVGPNQIADRRTDVQNVAAFSGLLPLGPDLAAKIELRKMRDITAVDEDIEIQRALGQSVLVFFEREIAAEPGCARM